VKKGGQYPIVLMNNREVYKRDVEYCCKYARKRGQDVISDKSMSRAVRTKSRGPASALSIDYRPNEYIRSVVPTLTACDSLVLYMFIFNLAFA
jgi:hypothetical protein